MILIVSGLPGAGKSVLVEMLAKHFKLKKVFASDILRKLLEKKNFDLKKTKKSKGFFESEKGRKLNLNRKKNFSFDKKLDKMLLKLIEKEDNIIVDSRTMPWLSKKGFKIWVTAPKKIRAERIAKRDSIPKSKALKLVDERLKNDKLIYKKLYGFNFGEDLKCFDLILNTAKLSKKEMFLKALKEIKLRFNC
jgi:cytidylate kinase